MLLRMMSTILVLATSLFGLNSIKVNEQNVTMRTIVEYGTRAAISCIGTCCKELADYYGFFDADTYNVVSEYCIDLTELAGEGKLKPVVGREKETEMLIETLTRKGKGNPCIIGEPGVGKTSLVEGLAIKIANGDVPQGLKNKKIMMLDIQNLIAGKSYKGSYVSRLRSLLNALKKNPDIILFFDEVHTITSLGADLWKPILNNEKVRIIGATTLKEYSYIKEDEALFRRFQTLQIDEPTKEQTCDIIRGIKENIEKHSGVQITDQAIKTAVNTSDRYLSGRYFPDKAIDIVSSTAAMVEQRYTSAGGSNVVTEDDVLVLVSRLSGVPIFKMTNEEKQYINSLKDKIKETIVGQDEAVEKLINSIQQSRMGLADENHPISSFLFAGSYGVGKTELCRVLAENAYGSKDALISINMSKYIKPELMKDLIGSYKSNKGILTEAVRKKPYSVVLFDEVDKADPSILSALLKIIDDGYIFDADGNKVDFSNTIIIMTSNSCHNAIIDSKDKTKEQINDSAIKELKNHIISGVFNRVDNIVVFNTLSKQDIKKIAKNELIKIGSKMQENKIQIEFTQTCIDAIADKGFSEEYGARAVKKFIQSQIKGKLTNLMAENKLKQGDKLTCDYADGEFKFNLCSTDNK